MKNEGLILGVDTSNYTTSVAVISESGELIANIKRPLCVKDGERGLRQSDAVFSHIKNLPNAFEEAEKYVKNRKILAVGVSSKPRRQEGSYMPCFLSGVASASALSLASGAPLHEFSHQCGHIMAAIYSSASFELLTKDFAAFHISGGTTELLKAHPEENGFSAELVGGTKDLNAGQIVDRIAVAMGLPFPGGKHLEELALRNTVKIPKRKVSREGLWLNLSGVENIALKLYKDTADKQLVAAFVFEYLGNAIAELSEEYELRFGKTHFVYAGGVMCNSIVKEKLKQKFECSFAEPAMSADNAVGIAYLALLANTKRQE